MTQCRRYAVEKTPLNVQCKLSIQDCSVDIRLIICVCLDLSPAVYYSLLCAFDNVREYHGIARIIRSFVDFVRRVSWDMSFMRNGGGGLKVLQGAEEAINRS
jgi:hypothetical protein